MKVELRHRNWDRYIYVPSKYIFTHTDDKRKHTFNASAAHPQRTDVRLDRRRALELIQQQISITTEV